MFEKEKEILPKQYPWLITKEKAGSLSGAELAAKNIKIELARAFPGVRFSVRSKYYAGGSAVHVGGSAVHVGWNGEIPSSEEINGIIFKYAIGRFDGMTDSYHYRKSVWKEVFGGTKYCMAHVDAV